jgi:para-nitrobenzyl esterase
MLMSLTSSFFCFLGNPNQITIFGESAGGGTVAMFLAIQSTWGLYQRVIMESGAVLLLADVDEQVNITTKIANE